MRSPAFSTARLSRPARREPRAPWGPFTGKSGFGPSVPPPGECDQAGRPKWSVDPTEALMRRIALLAACVTGCTALTLFLVPARASALTGPGLHKGVLHDNGVQLVRRGFRGGGVAWRGRGGRAYAWRGGGVRRAAVWRGGRAYAWRGGGVRRAAVWRGGRAYAWRGGRRYWRPGWGWVAGTAAVAAAPYYYGGGCPLVRRTVWTPRGYRVRWVRRCW
jgi:hypothetical protein